MEWKTWHNVDSDAGWNVLKAEKDITMVKQFANQFNNPEMADFFKKSLFPQMYTGDSVLQDYFEKAVAEMSDIMHDKTNASGYHVNHIKSGRTVFTLWNNNGKVYVYGGEYPTVEEAQEAAAQEEDAYVDTFNSKDGVSYVVEVLDEDETERMRSEEIGGEYVGEFDSYEEAQAEGNSLDRYYIEEMPKEEWWTVVHNDTSKAVYPMFFPSEKRALAFLYKAAQPKAWMDYVDYCCKKEGELNGV